MCFKNNPLVTMVSLQSGTGTIRDVQAFIKNLFYSYDMSKEALKTEVKQMAYTAAFK
jgi:hypothetical protein